MHETSTARRALEILLGDVQLLRRLPADLGGRAIYVSARAGGLRYWKLSSMEAMDPALLRFARRHVRKGDHVWDIGTNVGLFTFAAAHLAGESGRVVSLEPDGDVCALLKKSVARGHVGDARVDILQAAVSASGVGCVEFQVARRSRSSNAIVGGRGTQMGGVLETRLVPAISLDGLLSSVGPPSVVKIDVEGHEAKVLDGAVNLLSTIRPRFHIEVQAETWDDVSSILLAAGYQLFDGDHPNLIPCTGPVFNVVALHPQNR